MKDDLGKYNFPKEPSTFQHFYNMGSYL